jgi:hypothetical protein
MNEGGKCELLCSWFTTGGRTHTKVVAGILGAYKLCSIGIEDTEDKGSEVFVWCK